MDSAKSFTRIISFHFHMIQGMKSNTIFYGMRKTLCTLPIVAPFVRGKTHKSEPMSKEPLSSFSCLCLRPWKVGIMEPQVSKGAPYP